MLRHQSHALCRSRVSADSRRLQADRVNESCVWDRAALSANTVSPKESSNSIIYESTSCPLATIAPNQYNQPTTTTMGTRKKINTTITCSILFQHLATSFIETRIGPGAEKWIAHYYVVFTDGSNQKIHRYHLFQSVVQDSHILWAYPMIR